MELHCTKVIELSTTTGRKDVRLDHLAVMLELELSQYKDRQPPP